MLRFLFFLLARATAPVLAASRTSAPPGCLTVGKASGAYSTVQSAVDALSVTSKAAQCIFISPGTYKEQVLVPPRAAQLSIYGSTSDTSGHAGNTVTITASKSLAGEPSDDATGTLRVKAANFRLYNVNVNNGFGEGQQAIALSAYADSGYYGCAFTGFQDTVLAQQGYQLYSKCLIQGATDFVFGQNSPAWFEQCDIRVLTKDQGYVTASGRGSPSGTNYFVFNSCNIAAAPGNTVVPGSYFLGRPWDKYARVTFQRTSMTNVINPAGWHVWDATTPTSGVQFGENGNTGAGASGTRHGSIFPPEMSTFRGVVHEFPDITIDYFRHDGQRRPPLAALLSHIHSDHIAGLDNVHFGSPFIYCSAATKEILLRLEKYSARIAYAQGILEKRQPTYRHLKDLLRPLPLETSVRLELAPEYHIQVTLFNANHCPGAVMFLIEGQGKAILYTGDTRSEPWLVNALARSPSLLQYTQGLRTLDTLYLDTSFLENRHFQTKAEGLQELVRKVAQYPETTVFHFHAWTYGYEDVWIALSKALCSPVHVDEYKMSIYRSLMGRGPDKKSPAQYPLCSEAAALVGFQCGNRLHEGCLTLDDTVRLHSCEKGNYCKAVEKGPVVWIRPIVCRLPSGSEMQEAGIGGGGDELENIAELGRSYLARMTAKMQISLDDLLQSPAALREFVFDTFLSVDEASMAEVEGLEAFLRDVWPCTAVPSDWLREGLSIEDLFGDLCAEKTFRFDRFKSQSKV
ncbi:hypothetical protein P8C59_008760 [Phyllachora maydis]|nr:hypothetical protein P8C59_008760 [Phyllachora maydis]